MKTEKLEAQPPFFFGRWASRYTAAAVKITWTDKDNRPEACTLKWDFIKVTIKVEIV